LVIHSDENPQALDHALASLCARFGMAAQERSGHSIFFTTLAISASSRNATLSFRHSCGKTAENTFPVLPMVGNTVLSGGEIWCGQRQKLANFSRRPNG